MNAGRPANAPPSPDVAQFVISVKLSVDRFIKTFGRRPLAVVRMQHALRFRRECNNIDRVGSRDDAKFVTIVRSSTKISAL
jgi:hypothetical protein